MFPSRVPQVLVTVLVGDSCRSGTSSCQEQKSPGRQGNCVRELRAQVAIRRDCVPEMESAGAE
jgi:hypothetical protein